MSLIVSGRWGYDNYEDETYVVFIIRDGDEKKQVKATGVQPYFYMLPIEEKLEEVRANPYVKKIEDHGDYKKVYTRKPNHIRYIRDDIGREYCYEADIPFVRRFMIDEEIKLKLEEDAYDGVEDTPELENEYRKAYLDIECDNFGGFPESHKDQILMISVVTDDGKERCFSIEENGTEKEMLEAMFEFIEDYDIIAAWNGDDFDFPYIKDRAKYRGVDVDYWRWRWIDLLDAYKRAMFKVIDPLPSYSLDYVTQFELDDELKEMGGKFAEAYHNNYEAAKRYNLKDARVMKRIDEKRDIIPTFVQLGNLAGLFIDECLTYSDVVDTLVLRQSRDKDYVLPCESEWQEEPPDNVYQGATVFDPKPGMYQNVFILDFASLYPSVMRTFNISPDTLVVNEDDSYYTTIDEIDDKDNLIQPIDRDFWYKSERGMVPELLDDLQERRNEIKYSLPDIKKEYGKGSDEYREAYMKQYVIKTVMNTFYGYFGYVRGRLFDERMAGMVTYGGRTMAEETKRFVEEELDKEVVYGDTDSVYVKSSQEDASKDELIEEGKEIAQAVDDHLQDFLEEYTPYKEYIELELEKLMMRMVVLPKRKPEAHEKLSDVPGLKKKYFYRAIWDEGEDVDEVKVMGMETKRGDSSELTGSVQDKLVDILMHSDKFDKDVIFNEVKNYILDVRQQMLDGEWDDSLTQYKGLGQEPEEYDSPMPHARLAMRLKKEGTHNYSGGDKVPYIYGGYKNGKLYPVHPDEWEELTQGQKQVGYRLSFQKQVLDQIENFIWLLGRKKEDIVSTIRAKDLTFEETTLAEFID